MTKRVKVDLKGPFNLSNTERAMLRSIAKKFYSSLPGTSTLDLDDLYQEALIAFYLSWLDFDPTRGFTLHTYAIRRINNRMINVLKRECMPRRVNVLAIPEVEDYSTDAYNAFNALALTEAIEAIRKEKPVLANFIIKEAQKMRAETKGGDSPKPLAGAIRRMIRKFYKIPIRKLRRLVYKYIGKIT